MTLRHSWFVGACLAQICAASALASPSPGAESQDQLLLMPEDRQADQETKALDLVSAAAGDALRALQASGGQREDGLSGVVDRYVDAGFTLRASVPGDAWDSLSDAQRKSVWSDYRRLAAQQYARLFVGYSGQSLDVLQVEEIADGIVQVDTMLKAQEGKTTVSWVVALPGGGGRAMLRDVVLDGASTLAMQQAFLRALWEASGRSIDEFLSRFGSERPWDQLE